jgi:RNA recognition motif-containing protein
MDSDQGKLFIGGISWDTNEEKLKEHFSNYGDVLNTSVMREKNTGKPRGFGFVVFSDPSVLDRVLEDKHVIDGRTVNASPIFIFFFLFLFFHVIFIQCFVVPFLFELGFLFQNLVFLVLVCLLLLLFLNCRWVFVLFNDYGFNFGWVGLVIFMGGLVTFFEFFI